MRFPHALVLIQDVQASALGVPQEDDYGQPLEAAPSEVHFFGWLQPRTSQEMRQGNEAGVALSTHMLYAPPSLRISKNDHLRWDVTPDDLRRYEVNGDPRDAGGVGHHYETDVRQITS